jgi:hypothetical protein
MRVLNLGSCQFDDDDDEGAGRGSECDAQYRTDYNSQADEWLNYRSA